MMASVSANPLLKAARWYAKRNIFVFPLHNVEDDGSCSCRDAECKNQGKHPRTQHGFKDATIDLEKIGQWWTTFPKANIGIACEPTGWAVIDVDPRHGGDETLRDLEQQYGPLPDTVRQVTGSGGQHIIFTYPFGGAPTVAGIRPGIDTRARGGYIVGAPSAHVSGNAYAWEVAPGEMPLAELPHWFRDLLTTRTERQRTDEPGAVIPEGRRDETLASLAGSMRARGHTKEEIAAALLVTNRDRCVPPLDERDVRRIAWSISQYEAGKGAFVDTTREKAREEEAAAGLFVWPHELDNLPEMSWRVEGIMPNDSTGMLYGKFGSRKTFATLDMACCIATGKAWHGHAVEKGYVIYIYAEGLRGLKARLRAWEEAHKRKVENIAFVPRAIRFMDKKDVDFLIERISAEVPEMPVTVFIDTLARAMVGGDENDQKDMGLMVENADILRRATGATVWWNHHTNKVDDYRGSSALPGALDVMVKAEREGEILKLICEKMKDAEEFEDIELVATPVLQSIILTSKDSAGVRKARYDALSNDDKEAYRKLAEDLRGEATWGVWLTLTAMSKDSFKRCLERLQKAGMVKHDGIKKVYRSLYKVAEDTDEEVLL